MTGHIPGTTVLRRQNAESAAPSRGTNHVALRAANERLVLSLIRTHGQLSKAQIAELSGLTAQTASVICRSLVDAGLLTAGTRIRGKVGQPFVPLSLNPDGAMFFGLHVGGSRAYLALVDFVGTVVAERVTKTGRVGLAAAAGFAADAVEDIRSGYDNAHNARIQGLGVSIAPGSLARGSAEQPWDKAEQTISELGHTLDLFTCVSSQAVAACSAELIYGLGGAMSDFLYAFVGHSVSGGLVQGGHIRFSRDEGGANVGRMMVPDGEGGMVALNALAARYAASTDPADGDRLSRGLAHAAYAALSIFGYEAVIVDGVLPHGGLQKIVVGMREALGEIGKGGGSGLSVQLGSLSRKPLALGAACLPLARRFFPESA